MAIAAIALIFIAAGSVGLFDFAVSPDREVKTAEDIELEKQAACDKEDVAVRIATPSAFEMGGGDQDTWTGLFNMDYQILDYATDQSNLDASTNKDYYVVTYDDDTTDADAGNDWYMDIQKINTDCEDPYDVFFKLYPEGAVDTTVYNDDGSVNADTSNQQPLFADEEIEVELRIKAPNDAAFGAPSEKNDAKIRICFDYNTTVIDGVEVEGAVSASVPQFDIATSEECWEIDRKTFMDGENGRDTETYTLIIDTNNTNDPADGNDINIRLMDTAGYLHSETGEPMFGVVDDEGADVGYPVQNDATIYVE